MGTSKKAQEKLLPTDTAVASESTHKKTVEVPKNPVLAEKAEENEMITVSKEKLELLLKANEELKAVNGVIFADISQMLEAFRKVSELLEGEGIGQYLPSIMLGNVPAPIQGLTDIFKDFAVKYSQLISR